MKDFAPVRQGCALLQQFLVKAKCRIHSNRRTLEFVDGDDKFSKIGFLQVREKPRNNDEVVGKYNLFKFSGPRPLSFPEWPRLGNLDKSLSNSSDRPKETQPKFRNFVTGLDWADVWLLRLNCYKVRVVNQ